MKPIVAHRIFTLNNICRGVFTAMKRVFEHCSALHGDKKWSKTEKISHKLLFHLTPSTCASYYFTLIKVICMIEDIRFMP